MEHFHLFGLWISCLRRLHLFVFALTAHLVLTLSCFPSVLIHLGPLPLVLCTSVRINKCFHVLVLADKTHECVQIILNTDTSVCPSAVSSYKHTSENADLFLDGLYVNVSFLLIHI